jgi:hypothetical protein
MNRALPDLFSGKIVLLLGAHAAQGAMIELAAELARRGPLRVLDGGNRFNTYPLARALRRHTVDIDACLERIQLSRAFTCYQMEAMLAATPAQAVPTLALDLLATFTDENVPLAERERLLQLCAGGLRRLSRLGPVAVSARPEGSAQSDLGRLLETLRDAADQVWELGTPASAGVLQPPLF